MKGARGRGTLEKEKPPILGIIQRGGEVAIKMLANVQQVTIKPIILARVAAGAMIHTDKWIFYNRYCCRERRPYGLARNTRR